MRSAGPTAPLISVVIPAFNAEGVLRLQLEALDAQSDAPAFEVVVVDNGSTDGTARLVTSLAPTLSYPLRLISATDHQGPGYARNVGAAEAKADRLMFTDADDVVSRWWLAHGARAFEATSLWNGGARLMTDDEMVGSVEDIRAAAGDDDVWLPVEPGDLNNRFPVVMGCDFGCTREAFEAIGGFDQSLGLAYEDNDFGVRAHLAGIPVDSAPAVRIAYRGKWDIPFRAALARRQARGHVLTARRYGLRSESPMPGPIGEMTRPLATATLMAAGRRPKDWSGPYLRFVTGVGLAEGHLRYGAARRFPDPMIGVGYHRRELNLPTPALLTTSRGTTMRMPGGATAHRLLSEVMQSRLLSRRLRMSLLGRAGLENADQVIIVGGARIVAPADLRIGPGSIINEEVFIDRGPVTLGRNVYIGPRAVIITAHHSIGGPEQRAGDGAPAPVTVGDGTWIGANATILPNVTIGSGCIIAAGAVVTKNCEPNGVYAGVPARRIKDLPAGVAHESSGVGQ